MASTLQFLLISLYLSSILKLSYAMNYAKDQPRIVEKPIMFDITGGPGPSVVEYGHHAGYYNLPTTKAARMFYLFFESRNNKKNDPIVVWLTGGPSCSSQLALFYENGPLKISKDNITLTWNDYGWDLASNMIYVDMPIGVGFSYTTDNKDLRQTFADVANDIYSFLQEFLKGHPDYTNNDIYITGESFAGQYLPVIASRIIQGNKNKEGININLKGIAMGNALTDPIIQYTAYMDFALEKKLIQQSDYDKINMSWPDCYKGIKACGSNQSACGDAYYSCSQIFLQIIDITGDMNYYDIRKKCQGFLCYNLVELDAFLNTKIVKDALGVGDVVFETCSMHVYDTMLKDWLRDLQVATPTLLEEGIKILIYAGEEDLLCNWIGNLRWAEGMVWSGQKAFQEAQTVPFVVDGEKVGEMKSSGPFIFLKVYEAGHFVPMDQPKAALEMLKSWMQGKL